MRIDLRGLETGMASLVDKPGWAQEDRKRKVPLLAVLARCGISLIRSYAANQHSLRPVRRRDRDPGLARRVQALATNGCQHDNLLKC